MTPGQMSSKMSANTTRELLWKMRERYGRRGRQARSRLLDELCELCGYERKHAIKLLGGKRSVAGEKGRRGGPRRRYGEAERAVWKEIWLAAEQPCGKRLKAVLPVWLPHYESDRSPLAKALRERILAASAATLDRLLAPCRAALGSRGRCGTRPGTLLRKEIPVRTEHWDVAGPGWIEADTVAHCGESMAGDFVWSLTMTDVHTQWTETRACWNKGQHGVQARIAEVEAALPFAILGFDSDNGSEFLNWHLVDYFLGRTAPVAFTRSRPYRKNDNARVEQKNWTHVRQLIGYERLAEPAQAELLNVLYAQEWSQFRNFFCPTMKHLRTEVEGSRKKRIYDMPKTPFERLKVSGQAADGEIERLEKLLATLNPFTLKRTIEKKLRRILRSGAACGLKVAA
jgi:hypothetical protein